MNERGIAPEVSRMGTIRTKSIGCKNRKTWLLLLSVLLCASATWAFKPTTIHRSITGAAISGLTQTIDGQSIAFSERAVREIMEANEEVDVTHFRIPIFRIRVPLPTRAFWIPSNHFDGEQFVRSSDRLVMLRRQVVAAAQRQEGATARRLLGQALHTLQDFYAHSNWVEIGNVAITMDALGMETLPDPPTQASFCPNNPNILEGVGLQGLTSGYFFLERSIDITGSGRHCGPVPPGKCYHGLTGIPPCPGINKDDPDRPNHAVARSLALEHTRNYVRLILGDLETSPNPAQSIRSLMGVPAAMGTTGGSLAYVVDDTGSMINHMPRVRQSVRLTINQAPPELPGFRPVEFILVRFGDPVIQPAVVTRSAEELISLVDQIMPSGGGDCPELVIGGLLEGLRASQRNSVLILYTDSPSAKDERQFPAFQALLKEKNVKFYYLNFPATACPSLEIFSAEAGSRSFGNFVDQTGDQSREGPTFSRTEEEPDSTNSLRLLRSLAEDSGGQFFNLPRESDVIEVGRLLPLLAAADLVTIFRAQGNLDDGAKEFAVPVDSTVNLLSVSVTGGDIGTIALERPSGTQVQSHDHGVSFTKLSSGTIITVEAPEPGMWRLSVPGSGNFTITAQANSPIQPFSFDFGVLATDDPVHLGFVPIPGQPIVGTTLAARARLIGPFKTAEFRLVDESGETLQTIDLVQGDPDLDADDFLGSFPLPSVPFRVAVSGLDKNDEIYERLFPTLFRAQSVEVRLDPATASNLLPIGTATTFRGTVSNFGDPASFQLQAIATTGAIVDAVLPDMLTLGTGEVGSFSVRVVVPADTAEGTEILLTATAISTTEPTLTNNFTIELIASEAANLLPVANAGPDQVASVGSLVTLDGSGSFDPDNGPAPLSFSWTQIDGPEAVTLTGETTATPSVIANAAGNYRFALTISDGEAMSFANHVTIIVVADSDSVE